MPLLAASASDVTASVKAGAEVNAAVGGAVAKSGSSAPPRAGGSAAASAAVTQTRSAQRSTTRIATVLSIPPVVFIPRPPASWSMPTTANLGVIYPGVVIGSFDGSRILATRMGPGRYMITTNRGASWNTGTSYRFSPFDDVDGGAMSYDGTRVILITSYGSYATSSNGGESWGGTRTISTAIAGTTAFRGVTMSSDGTKIAIIAGDGGYVVTSTDSGATWVQRTAAGARVWRWITGSADGNILIAADGTNSFRSTDGGATWSSGRAHLGNSYAMCSADGMNLIAIPGAFTFLRVSLDGGATWTSRGISENWRGVTISADGTRMIATARDSVWLSVDSGTTWVRQTSPLGDFRQVYISGDGSQVAMLAHSESKVYFGTYA